MKPWIGTGTVVISHASNYKRVGVSRYAWSLFGTNLSSCDSWSGSGLVGTQVISSSYWRKHHTIPCILSSNIRLNQCSGSEINNFGSGSGSGSSNWKSGISDPDPSVTRDGEKKSWQFWLLWRQKWVEIFNFLNFASIVYEIMMNLFTF